MKIKKLDHLSSIFHEYDAFIIDLWGVMHNGVSLNNSAVKAVSELQSNGKRIVFLSNAPRPTKKLVEFLKKMKMEDKFLRNVFTSGEAALNSLKQNKFGKKFYHLGPQRDDSLFIDVKQNKTTLEESDFILCTGLFDEESENLKNAYDEPETFLSANKIRDDESFVNSISLEGQIIQLLPFIKKSKISEGVFYTLKLRQSDVSSNIQNHDVERKFFTMGLTKRFNLNELFK